jgi:hypothetical protein
MVVRYAVDTCAVIKRPVCCVACGAQQYETLLRISQARPVVCLECRQPIDLPRDNSSVFASARDFVEAERANSHLTSALCHHRLERAADPLRGAGVNPEPRTNLALLPDGQARLEQRG